MNLAADSEQIAKFVDALFRYADEGSFVSLRAFDDKEKESRLSQLEPSRSTEPGLRQ